MYATYPVVQQTIAFTRALSLEFLDLDRAIAFDSNCISMFICSCWTARRKHDLFKMVFREDASVCASNQSRWLRTCIHHLNSPQVHDTSYAGINESLDCSCALLKCECSLTQKKCAYMHGDHQQRRPSRLLAQGYSPDLASRW